MLTCWDCMQENSPLSITARTEWHYTLWTRRKIIWRNHRRRLRVNSCQSCFAQSWILRNGGSFGAKRTGRGREQYGLRRRVMMYLREWKERDTYRHLGWSHFDHSDDSRSFDFRNLLTKSLRSGVGRRPFNILCSSWCPWEDEDLDHKCGPSGFLQAIQLFVICHISRMDSLGSDHVSLNPGDIMT